MKSLLMIFMMLIISSAAFAADFNIDGRWIGSPGGGTVIFEFRAEGKKLIGLYLGSGAGDEKREIQRGKIKKNKINFEVPIGEGSSKRIILYKGKIKSDNEIQLTSTTKARGPRPQGFGERTGSGFDSVGGGMGGFGGASQESAPFILKRVVK
jgi:hypothetical protein